MSAEIRAIKTAAEQMLVDAYADAKAKLPGQGAIKALRDDAFKRFDAQGLPHRRVEEWKYTDLRALMRDAKALAGAPDAAGKARAKKAAAIFKGIDCRRLTFVDGVFVPDLSDLSAEKGLRITSMSEALAKGDTLVLAHVGKVFETNDAAVALNTALMGDGAVIEVSDNVAVAKPILLVFSGSQPASSFIRSLIVVGKGARLFLIESHDSEQAQVNAALDLVVGDNAVFDHVKLTAAKDLHLASTMVRIGSRARFNSFAFASRSSLVRNQMFLRFAGEGTEASIGGISLLKSREHVDNTLVIEHAAPGCASRERFRSVLDGESRAVFQGKIVVQPDAQKTDAKMLSNALLLSDDAEADNKPELEIFADDVQCGHGATAGALDEDLLFYLRARGIPQKEAEALLIQAFIGEVIDTIAQESAREPLMKVALEWLEARN